MTVSPTAAAALAKNELAVGAHIEDYLTALGILNKRALGNGNDNVLTALAVHLTRHTVLSVFSNEFALIAEGKKGVCTVVNSENNISATAAVAAIGTTGTDVLFSMEGDGTVSAVTRLNVNLNIIYKHILHLCGIIAALSDNDSYGSTVKAEGIAQAVFNISAV